MASCSNPLSADNASFTLDNIHLSNESPSRSRANKDEEEEYDEDEDVDFNPFLKETPSPVASSSLSSEIEAFDGEIVNSPGNNNTKSLKPSVILHNLDSRGDCENGEEESAVQSNVSSEERCDRDSEKIVQREWMSKNSESVSQTEGENLMEKEITRTCTVELNEGGGDLCDSIKTQKPMLNSTEEGAICMRTRARYSLASITLDELEAFLQETDDEDDFQNVNDEEEYRKFLAAVLQGGDEECQLVQKNKNSDDDDDDDEDNDADFEIELEEALVSDDEEAVTEMARTGDKSSTMRRPATRGNRQQNVYIQCKRNSPEQRKRSLRPLVPILPTGHMSPLLRRPATGTVVSSGDGLVNGFSQPQVRQLHCLIHEHVQLLIQVFSLSVLDPSRRDIATQVRGLISEMLRRHEETLSRRHQSHPVSSVLDVASLDLAGRYLDDVTYAVREYRRSQVESGCDASSERVPLFPLPHSISHQVVGNEVSNGSSLACNMSQLPSNQPHSKKTLAATLVESAKKQSVALVQKDIANLVQRFFPLFNSSLFPHKPPPAAVANRVLFTDAEDELLALGIMEYNSDWKAIQQRFLPCKSKHQIFVRQKNRCSSKALENPIKAVRRMKSSPLTAGEITHIQEGLRYFKFDWMSVWKFIVPYRDPSLLPRQWRIALGVQKSYKQDDAKKEKRRLYELKRRSRALLTNEQHASEKEDCRGATNSNENNVGDELVDNPSEAYVHEGFLADPRPGMLNLPLYSIDNAKDVPGGRPESAAGTITRGQSENLESSGAQLLSGSMQKFAPTLMPPDHYVSSSAPGVSRPQIVMRPYRARKLYTPRLVRLAPELPPLNLPPSVRIISQSVFTKNHSEASTNARTVKVGISDASRRENLAPQPTHLSSANGDKNFPPRDKVVDLRKRESEVAEETCGVEERDTDLDLQMHPLLFRNPDKGQLTCYSLNSGPGGSSSFSFFPDNRPQLLSLFNSPKQVNLSADKFQKGAKLSGCNAEPDIGFHPLLQRIEYPSGISVSAGASLSPVGTKGRPGQHQDPCGAFEKTQTVSSQPSRSGGNTKRVDLDIHLSSSSSMVKDFCGNIKADSTEIQNKCLTQDNPANCDRHVSQVPASAAPTGGISRCLDEIGDQSNLGIVMEQEELSDSDEDMEEENVEFECEEMADSEGEEGSECEEITRRQDKDGPSSAVENTVTEADSERERRVENPDHSQPTELGKDSMSSPWLSLDSSSRRITRKASKHTGKTTTEEPANKRTAALCGPSRSCKKGTPTKRRVTEAREEVGISRLLSLGPLAIPTVKKPRKRVCRANTNVNVETIQETSRSNNKDKC